MDFVSERIRKLIPYTAGEQVEYIIKLNTNENPYPPTPRIKEVLESVELDKLKLYPDQHNKKLKRAIGEKYNVAEDMVFVGNGSDEILALLHPAFFGEEGERIAYPDVTYSFYPVYNEFFNIQSINPPLKDDFTIDLNDYNNLDVKGYIFANPNAPTSIALKKEQLERFFAEKKDKLIIVDEAYVDFCNESVVPLTLKYDNLLVIQTFSKGYSLAGIRCGYAIGNKALIDGLKKVKDSFNNYPVDYITEMVATEAIKDIEYYKGINGKVIATREKVSKILQEMGFNVLPSCANFIFVSHPVFRAYELYIKLKERKILVRQWNKKRIENFLRVTIGTDIEMEIFIDNLKDIMK